MRITKNSNIVILTGAGISAESGLATFRASDGLWEGHRVEDVATPEAFIRNPDMVHDFYNQRRAGLLDPNIQPNPAHEALAELEQKWEGDVLVVTQNIDDLHERGGTKNLLHMHGEVLKGFCTNCRDTEGHSNETTPKIDVTSDMNTQSTCEICGYSAGIRPDIVWFGEMPYYMDQIYQALQNCDVFISIGTSGNVYPAAGFVQQALANDAHTIEMNLEPSLNATMFHESIIGPAGKTVPEFVASLLE